MHQYPEVSGEEIRTTRLLQGKIAEAGLPARTGPGERGLMVDGGAGDGDRIAFRADIDALRIQEAAGKSCRSLVDGVMHACGHDGHAATVLAAVLALGQAEREGFLPWPVRWRAIFQPAEETNRGAVEMIEAGALADVGAILGLHMDPSREAGTIGLKPGELTADCDEMEIRIQGRGGHAARPHESLDPIAAAAQLISSIYLFIPRGIAAHEPVVVTVGQIYGGENSNVIPDLVKLRGTVRSVGGEIRKRTLEHIRQLARGVAEASGTRIDVSFVSGPAAVYNDPSLTDLIHRCATGLLGHDHVQPILRASMGGEDFSHYLANIPGCMFRLGCAPDQRPAPPLHSPEFDLDERAISAGAKLIARTVVEWCNPEEGDPVS